MDYVVDDVVRRVKSTGASPAALCRRNEGGGREDGIPGPVVAYGRGGGRSDVNTGGAGIPGVVEAVLRIGGSAMGPALVRKCGICFCGLVFRGVGYRARLALGPALSIIVDYFELIHAAGGGLVVKMIRHLAAVFVHVSFCVSSSVRRYLDCTSTVDSCGQVFELFV